MLQLHTELDSIQNCSLSMVSRWPMVIREVCISEAFKKEKLIIPPIESTSNSSAKSKVPPFKCVLKLKKKYKTSFFQMLHKPKKGHLEVKSSNEIGIENFAKNLALTHHTQLVGSSAVQMFLYTLDQLHNSGRREEFSLICPLQKRSQLEMINKITGLVCVEEKSSM